MCKIPILLFAYIGFMKKIDTVLFVGICFMCKIPILLFAYIGFMKKIDRVLFN